MAENGPRINIGYLSYPGNCSDKGVIVLAERPDGTLQQAAVEGPAEKSKKWFQ